MEGTKGIHGLATGIFAILIVWVSWNFLTPLFSNSNSVITTIYWATYIIIVLMSIIGIPMMISWNNGEGEASIASMLYMQGTYLAGVLFMQIFFPLMDALTGPNIFSDPLHIQILSALIMLAGIVTLLIFPILMGTIPKSAWNIGREMLGEVV